MATTVDFIGYVCEQINGTGDIRHKKMFGEYMVYVNDKPILLVCDNTVFVKKLDCIADKMKTADVGFPTPARRSIIFWILTMLISAGKLLGF